MVHDHEGKKLNYTPCGYGGIGISPPVSAHVV
jgi:hypothetical protein